MAYAPSRGFGELHCIYLMLNIFKELRCDTVFMLTLGVFTFLHCKKNVL